MGEAPWSGRRIQTLTALVKETYPPLCWLCHAPIDTDAEYSLDHVVPRSMGGDVWDINNIRPAHLRCNSSRGNRTPTRKQSIPQPSRGW
jgi:5-methylcytosine-specific restriction endonuclease McrA